MYSRRQASLIRQEFWTGFGQYIRPAVSATGMRINWINYKTGEPHLLFRMNADHRHAFIGIVLTHSDPGVQELYFDQFSEMKNMLHHILNEEWLWEKLVSDEQGKTVSRIYTELEHVSILRREDWPALISFFKPRLLALDTFWSDAKIAFEMLR